MQNVANDGHPQILKITFALANREHIQHRLGGVRVAPVSGINDVHMGWNVTGNQVGCAARTISDHEHIGVHGFECSNGIEDGLPFGGR